MPDLHPDINGTVSLKRFGCAIVPASEFQLGKECENVFFSLGTRISSLRVSLHGSPSAVCTLAISTYTSEKVETKKKKTVTAICYGSF